MYKLHLLAVCCIFYINTVYAQKYNFTNFSVGEGLTQSEIYAICEDQRGNIWFGSLGGGVVKYDGYEFISYREEDGLKDNFVHSIVEDNEGLLWFGTENGLCTYNGVKFNAVGDTNQIGNIAVRTIYKDFSGNLWFGSNGNGLFKYSQQSFTSYSPDTNFPSLEIFDITESSDSSIWLATNKGAYKFKNNTFIRYTKKDGLPSEKLRAICTDEQNNIWLATYGSGVSCYDGKNFKTYTVYEGLSNNTVYTAFNDRKGNLWFGTAHGISKYNGQEFKIYRENSGLASNIVVCIFKDSFDNLWFGTAGGGVSRFDNERFTHYTKNDKMGRWIYSLIQAPNGNMLFGSSEGGVTVYDGSEFSLLKEAGGFTNSRVISMHYTKDSTLWCGTLDDGVFKFKRRGFKHFNKKNGFLVNNITAISSDTSGNVWFASLDSGICIYREKADTFYTFTKENGLSGNSFYTLCSDKSGNIWAGTVNNGINVVSINPDDSLSIYVKTYNNSNGLSGNVVKSIIMDTLGTIYIGTAGEGINIYKDDHFFKLNKSNGMLSENIYLLLLDNDNNLWAGTEEGVDKIILSSDFSILNLKHYGRNEGFSGIEVYRNSCIKDNSGNLWFGTINGATKYTTKYDSPGKIPPLTHITGIRLFYQKIEDTRYVDTLAKWYPIPQKLTLPYTQNNLTFEFTGIYHRNPKAVRYKWILEGYDEQWSPVLNQREVTYSNLSPGTYTFNLLACNENDIWNEEPACYSFIILTPIWQRPWFIVLLVCAIISIIWSIVYLRISSIKKRNKAEQEKLEMEKNLIVLEQEASRLQMNPHFIFNSLNSIQGFIAINDAFEAKKHLAKFARLMRLILENAREEFIPLENEIEILENYMELEKLSTNNKFDFKIEVENNLNTEATEIPPMMIQPFVENAIIHGIKRKEGRGFIQIAFKSLDNCLICNITDDGIGREQAAANKKLQAIKQKSTGILVTQKRLEQYKIQTKIDARIDFVDLTDNSGKPAGTRVMLTIPCEFQ